MMKPGRNSIRIRPLFVLFLVFGAWFAGLVWAFISIIFVELHALRSFLFTLQTRTPNPAC